MKKILVLLAHPNPSQSQINKRMSAAVKSLPGVTLVDLYALYPRFRIEVAIEQERLVEHDVIVFQFPVYWYSTPPLLKEWQDVVLQHGFAYGDDGDKLAGKLILVAATAGGAESTYAQHGSNHFSMRTLLAPLEQTARLCQMQYLPPFVQFAASSVDQDEKAYWHVKNYKAMLEALRDERLDLKQAFRQELMLEPELPLIRNEEAAGTTSQGESSHG